MTVLEIFQNPTIENVASFAEEIKSRIAKKPKENGLFESVFKTFWKEMENPHWQKSNIIAACNYLINLKIDSPEHFENKAKVCLADLCKILRDFFGKNEFNNLFSMNTQPSYKYWQILETINHSLKLPENIDFYSKDLPVLYLMRLSLESRIHGILGIDFIRVKNDFVNLSTLIKITGKLESIKFDPIINWNRIEKINTWISHFMHRHVRPFPWAIDLAINELRPLFSWDERKCEGYEEFGWYLSTTVKSQKSLFDELKSHLDKKYNGDYFIRWSGTHEVHLKK